MAHRGLDTYGGIEESSTDAEEDPDIDKQRKAKSQGDVQESRSTWWAVDGVIGRRVGNLSCGKCEGQEQGSAHDFSQEGDEQMADSVWKP